MNKYCIKGKDNEEELMSYLKKNNVLIEIEMNDFFLNLIYFDLEKKEYEIKTYHSEDEIKNEIKRLKKDFEPLDKIDEKLEKEIETYGLKRDYTIEIYRKEKYYIIAVKERMQLFFIDIEKDYTQKVYSNLKDFQEILNKKIKGYTLENKDSLDEVILETIYLIVELEDVDSAPMSEEENKSVYKPQISTEFPFFGAGNATYFEYFGLTIYFATDLDEKLQNKILQCVPEDFHADLDDFNGKFLNLYMEYGYEGMASIYHENFDVLNTNIEKALIDIHKMAPIIFAYRAEDTEASGTHFSQWHKDSKVILMVERIEQNMNIMSSKEVNDLKEYLKEIYDLYGFKGKDKRRFTRKEWSPKKPLMNYETLIQKLKNEEASSSILYDVYDENTYEEDIFYKLFKNIKTQKFKDIILDYRYITEIISHAQKMKDTKTVAYFTVDIIVNSFNRYMVGMLTTEKLIKFVNIYFPLLPDESDTIDIANIDNILFDFIEANELNIAMNKERNTILLDKALKYASKKPSILYNASCMYSEMNEIEKAYECIKKTIEYKLNKKSSYHFVKELKLGIGSFENLAKDKNFELFIAKFEEKLNKRF